MPCKVFYGYKDLSDVIEKYKILDDEGLEAIKKRLAWELNFRLERTYGDIIRKLYFTIFEISSIYRELAFRNANPAYVLPSVVSSLNTTLELTVQDNKLKLKTPLAFSVRVSDLIRRFTGFSIDNIQGNSVSIDLSKFTGVREFFLDAKMDITNGDLNAIVDLRLPLQNRGLNRDVKAGELNQVLVVTARETNQKAIGVHQQLSEVSQSLIESIIEPILYDVRDEFARREGVSEFVYVPYARPFILNATFSALNSEEEAQLFGEKCKLAVHKLRKMGEIDLGEGLKLTKDGKVVKDGEEVSDPSLVSYAVLKALVKSTKNAVIVIEYPEEYQTEEMKVKILEEIRKLAETGNVVYIVTSDKNFMNC